MTAPDDPISLRDPEIAFGARHAEGIQQQTALAIGPIIAVSLRGSSNRYKIKLRAAGFRLVYEVRDRNAVYRQADQRREDFALPPCA